MTIRRITIKHPGGYVERQWAAHCPCPPTPMLYRTERSEPAFAWAARHLDRYHPKGAQ